MVLLQLLVLHLLILLSNLNFTIQSECVPSSLNPHACMCNSTHCDDIPTISWCPNESQLHLYVTSESGARFSPSVINFNPNGNNSTDLTIDIDPCKTHQTIIGFGGAMTDSAALMISCLSDGAKKNLMDSYFDCDKGIGYDLLRVPLGASDYSESLYTYDDTSEPDINLEHFGLNEMDTKYKIPLIKLAQNISCRNIRIKAATWKAPNWMMAEKLGYKSRSIGAEYEETWALYHLKAIQEYESQGIPITFLSGGNEVEVGVFSVLWDLNRYKNWLTNKLCPIVKDKVKLLALDDQTIFLPNWMKILDNSTTNDCLTGFATHWYADVIPGIAKPIQEKFCSQYPEKILISSESSICKYEPSFNKTTDWRKAERYAIDIIDKLSSCSQAYIDWNLALDLNGGPNWRNNFCYSAISVNCEADEFYKNILFYVLGHFSKFVPEGSVRVEATAQKEGTDSKNLKVVAFRVETEDCTNENLITVILNPTDVDFKTNVCIRNNNCATLSVPKKSIITTVSIVPPSLACM